MPLTGSQDYLVSQGFATDPSGIGSLIVTRGLGGNVENPFDNPSEPTFLRFPTEPRGIRWANVPKGKSENIVHGGARVKRVNAVMNLLHDPISKDITDVAGSFVFRFVDQKRRQVPAAVRHYARHSVNSFGEPFFPSMTSGSF